MANTNQGARSARVDNSLISFTKKEAAYYAACAAIWKSKPTIAVGMRRERETFRLLFPDLAAKMRK